MRIELDLPDWVNERHIRIFAGIELVAFKLAHEDFWKVKDGRCQMCGECCTNLKNHLYPTINGECIHLGKDKGDGKRPCNIALYRSRACGADSRKCNHITYKVIPCK